MRELTIQSKTLNVGFQITGLVLITILAYWPATAALWHYWIDDLYVGGHGLLVAGLAAWLLYRSCRRVARVTVQPSPWALVPLLACSVAALVFLKAGIHTLQLLTLPALIWLAVLAAFGRGVARTVAVPIGYLYFAMPAWNLLSVPLQALTLWMVSTLAPIGGLPATVSGSLVAFPNGARFAVTLACSGVGFLVQGLAVATLLGELENATLGRRLRLAGSMVLIALATNWIRVLLLLMIGYFGGMNNVIVARHHLLFGYALFIVVLVVFAWVAARPALPLPGADAASVAANERRAPLSGYLIAIVALTIVPVLATIVQPIHQYHPSAGSVLSLPERGNWRGRNVEAVAISDVTPGAGRELVKRRNSLVGRGLAPVETPPVEGGEWHYRETVTADIGAHSSVLDRAAAAYEAA
jgi:exosortase